jgi:glucose/arabinose dehydrogenase
VQRLRLMRLRSLLWIAAIVACSSDSGTGPSPLPGNFTIQLIEVASGLSSPLYLTSPANDSRLFVVEQAGRIRIIKNGQVLAQPFLDIVPRVSSGGERGLLSVAFHPSYAANGFFYVNFTDLAGNTRVERFKVSSNPDVGDASSSKLILGVTQPFANHNGGLNLFGPDGMLYIGLGDGGSGGDPQGNGQRTNTLLGKILRIDVDNGDPYSIPSGNPFANQSGARPEIWAYGLRNPWRFSFDRTAGLLFVADVGQGSLEEIDVVPTTRAGVNYGWNIMEGSSCFGSGSCSTAGLEPPVIEYNHSGGACSVTGGYAYRGSAIPELAGHYFYSDYCAGFLRSFLYLNGAATDQRTWDVGTIGSVTSFGEDAAGEMYIVVQQGRVYRIGRGP